MKHINQSEFKKEVIEFEGVVLVDFYADWCGPCKMLGPIIEEMDKENKEKDVKFVKINVDENQELAGMFGVMSIPTVLIFKNGKIADQRVGVEHKADYLKAITAAKDFKPSADGEVTIFSTPTCPYCTMAKSYLKEKNVKFKDHDVSKDHDMARKMIAKSGQMGVPQLWINGQVVIGFNKPQIDALLGL